MYGMKKITRSSLWSQLDELIESTPDILSVELDENEWNIFKEEYGNMTSATAYYDSGHKLRYTYRGIEIKKYDTTRQN